MRENCLFSEKRNARAKSGFTENMKKREEYPAIKSRCAEFGTLICGSGMRARNLRSEGAAALSGVFWALLIPGNKLGSNF
jgi:hypothetical protein